MTKLNNKKPPLIAITLHIGWYSKHESNIKKKSDRVEDDLTKLFVLAFSMVYNQFTYPHPFSFSYNNLRKSRLKCSKGTNSVRAIHKGRPIFSDPPSPCESVLNIKNFIEKNYRCPGFSGFSMPPPPGKPDVLYGCPLEFSV